MTTPSRPLILVIDDEYDHAAIVAAMLRRKGFGTAIACDARRGIELACELKPAVIFLDLFMPSVDGFAAAERLQVDESTRGVPIIFMSAGPPPEDVGGVLPSGYLAKPFRAAELFAVVERVLAGVRPAGAELLG